MREPFFHSRQSRVVGADRHKGLDLGRQVFVSEPNLVELLGRVRQRGVDQTAMGVGCEEATVEHQQTDEGADAVLPPFQDQVPKPQCIPKSTLHIVGAEWHVGTLLIDDAIKAAEPPFTVLHHRDLVGRQQLHELPRPAHLRPVPVSTRVRRRSCLALTVLPDLLTCIRSPEVTPYGASAREIGLVSMCGEPLDNAPVALHWAEMTRQGSLALEHFDSHRNLGLVAAAVDGANAGLQADIGRDNGHGRLLISLPKVFAPSAAPLHAPHPQGGKGVTPVTRVTLPNFIGPDVTGVTCL
jgi:hypothetical protein